MYHPEVARVLRDPVLDYVTKYIPPEFDESFDKIETWIDILSDVFNLKEPQSSSELVTRPRCLTSAEKYIGRIKRNVTWESDNLTDFRKKVAILIVILIVIYIVVEKGEMIVDQLNERKWDIAEKAVKVLFKRHHKKIKNMEKRRELLELTGDVEYL